MGSICIALSLAASELEKITGQLIAKSRQRLIGTIVPIYLLLCLGTFAILSPIAFWWKVPLLVAAYLVSRYYLAGKEASDGGETGK